jgi:hypothetical protein
MVGKVLLRDGPWKRVKVVLLAMRIKGKGKSFGRFTLNLDVTLGLDSILFFYVVSSNRFIFTKTYDRM